MYLAPLNYDRFFRKVFSHTHIAKAFLEDFLDVKIEEITLLERAHLLTNKAMRIEVDFRCKIAGSYIIIDMQQWYKPDVVRRFYLYHCASTALQLEDLPEKKLPIPTNDERAKAKDYRSVEPVLTLVWMVDDSLEFTENLAAYTTAPETLLDFVHNKELWEKNDLADLLANRKIVLQVLENRHKDLHFLQQNRLIFMFQNNIVNDTKFTKYRRWFEFAEKTRNKKNRSTDFASYKNEEIFKEMMRIILKKSLDAQDLTYIESEDEHIRLVNRTLQGVREDALAEGLEKGEQIGLEKGEQIGLEKGKLIGLEKGEQIGLEKGKQEEAQRKTIEGIKKALKRGKLSLEEIAEDFEVNLAFVGQIKAEMSNC